MNEISHLLGRHIQSNSREAKKKNQKHKNQKKEETDEGREKRNDPLNRI